MNYLTGFTPELLPQLHRRLTISPNSGDGYAVSVELFDPEAGMIFPAYCAEFPPRRDALEGGYMIDGEHFSCRFEELPRKIRELIVETMRGSLLALDHATGLSLGIEKESVHAG